MKIFKISYSEDVPVYDIEVEAENMSEAVDKAKKITFDEKDIEIDIWNIKEKVEITNKDTRWETISCPYT